MRANIIALVLVLVTLLAGAAFADKAITGINVVNKSDRVIITVQGTSALNMASLKSAKGHYVGFQFPCKLTARGRLVGIRAGKIYNVRYSNFSANPAATRVVVNTTGHVVYSTDWSTSKDRVEITVWKNGKPKKSAPGPESQAPEAASAVSASASHSTDRPIARLRTQVPVLYASASTSAMPVPSARPAEPVTKVLGVTEEAKPNVRRPVVVARVESNGTGRFAQELEKRVSLNFLGADINDVLKALSVQSGHNIVASKDVAGNVTVSLSEVTVDEAMDYVAKLSGYSYSKEKGTYLVGSKDSLNTLRNPEAARPRVEVVALNFTKGDDVISLLKAQYADVQANKTDLTRDDKSIKGSMLVLSGPEERVAQAAQLVNKIEDSLRVQAGENVTQVYSLMHVSAFEMRTALSGLVPEVTIALAPSDGFDLFAPEAVKGAGGDSAGGATIEKSKITKKTDELGRIQALILTGPETSVKRAMDLATQLDVKSPQIKFEAKVTSINKSGEKKLGLDWDWGDFAFAESVSLVSHPPLDTEGKPYSGFEPTVTPTNRFFRSPWNFKAALDAIITNGDGELLASPSLICVEGKPGVFFVGDEVTYIQRIETTATGQNIITDSKQVGVQLRVNGDVSSDGFITVNLHPEVSVLKLSVEQGVTLPIVSRRFTDHVVRVKDGATIVIGGLIRNDDIEQMSKVPLLGDLPFLGKLFRHTSKTTDHTEVVMFITASIVKD